MPMILSRLRITAWEMCCLDNVLPPLANGSAQRFEGLVEEGATEVGLEASSFETTMSSRISCNT
jgi:hypothetical protein